MSSNIRPILLYVKEDLTFFIHHSLVPVFPNRAIHLKQVTVTCRAWTTPRPSQRPIEPPTSARRLVKERLVIDFFMILAPGQCGLDKVCFGHLDVAGKQKPYPSFVWVSFVPHGGGGDDLLLYLKGCAW